MIDAILGSICFLLLGVGASWLGGLVVFAPLNERTLLFKVRSRFRIADLISLAILLQVGVGASLALSNAEELEVRAALTILVLIVVAFWWVTGLRMLSRAGVENGMHRGLFLTVHLPLGYLSVLGLIVSVVLTPLGMSALGEPHPWIVLVGILLLLLPVLCAATGWSIHRVCRSMANRARDDQANREGISFDVLTEEDGDPQIARYVVAKRRQRDEGMSDEAGTSGESAEGVVLGQLNMTANHAVAGDSRAVADPADASAAESGTDERLE